MFAGACFKGKCHLSTAPHYGLFGTSPNKPRRKNNDFSCIKTLNLLIDFILKQGCLLLYLLGTNDGISSKAFLLFASTGLFYFYRKTVGFSRIRTQIIRVEGEHADHLTTTTANLQQSFING